MMDEDWSVLMSFLPPQWKELAKKTNALKGLRRDKAPGKVAEDSHGAPGMWVFTSRNSGACAPGAVGGTVRRSVAEAAAQVQGLALLAVRGIVSRAWPGFGGGGSTGVSSDRRDDGEGTWEDGQLVACAL